MKLAIWKVLTGGLCLIISLSLQAATVRDLYSVVLMVPEQFAQPTTSQLSEGVAKVLVKVSGRSNVLNIPGIRSALSAPQGLLQQFSYQATQTPISAGDGREVLGQRLQLDFDSVQVNRLLQRNGVRPIGHARPVLMVWLASQSGNAPRDFMAPEGRVYSQFSNLARQRALPVEIPLLDLTDQQSLDVSDLWGFFRAPIEQASARYQPDAILVGRLFRHPNGAWQTRWLLINGEQVRNIEPTGSLTAQLTEAVNISADTVLASLGSINFSYIEEGLKLEISNVNGVDDYLQLLDYVRQLPPVEKALLHQVESDRVTLRVVVQGGTDALAQAIHLNPRMSASPRLNNDPANEQILAYRWQQ